MIKFSRHSERGLLAFLVLSLVSQFSEANGRGKVNPRVGPSDLFRFRLTPISLIQQNETTFSVSLDWVPSFEFSDRFIVHPFMGLGPRSARDSLFVAFDAGFIASYEIYHPLRTEVGIGVQSWQQLGNVGTPGTLPVAYLNLVYSLSGKAGDFLDGVVLGYSPIYNDLWEKLMHEVRLGVELDF